MNKATSTKATHPNSGAERLPGNSPSNSHDAIREALKKIAAVVKVDQGHGHFHYRPALSAEEAQDIAFRALQSPHALDERTIETTTSVRTQPATGERPSEQGAEILFTCHRCESNFTVPEPTNECPVCSWRKL